MFPKALFAPLLTGALLYAFPAEAQKEGQDLIDSLLGEAGKADEDTNKAKLLYEVAFEYYVIDPDQGITHSEELLQLAKRIGWRKGEAMAHNTYGLSYWDKSDYAAALDHFFQAQAINEQIGNLQGLARNLGNIGLVYDTRSDYLKALEYGFRALKLNEEIGDRKGIALNLGNIGVVYKEKGEYDKALEYYGRAQVASAEVGDRNSVARNLGNAGEVYMLQGRYDEALDFMGRSLRLNEELDNKSDAAIDLGNIGEVYCLRTDFAQALAYNARALALNRETGDVSETASILGKIGAVYLQVAQSRPGAAVSLPPEPVTTALLDAELYTDSAINLLREVGGDLNYLQQFYRNRSEINELQGDYRSALANYKEHVQARDTIFNAANLRKLAQLEEQRTEEVHHKELQRQRVVRNGLMLGIALVVAFAGVFFFQRERIRRERDRSDELLLNILPEEVADELKEKGSAQARQFEQTTILFTDFKGFTEVSEQLSPQELVEELNTCFKAFDGIVTQRGIEKIKTIGDAYMCAGGLSEPASSSPVDVVQAALQMQGFMIARRKEREAHGLLAFEMRVGIHTGPVVAGIVGVKKFAYDIWGDTVNIASRMETSGEVGQVNISESTYALVKDGPGLTFTPRGKVQAKGKGELEMYFVSSAPAKSDPTA